MSKSPQSKTFIFFTLYPFIKHHEKYEFNYLLASGYKIRIINLLALVNPASIKDFPEYYNFTNKDGVKEEGVGNLRELRRLLEKIKGWRIAIFVLQPKLDLLHTLNKFDIDFVFVFNHLQPHHHSLSILSNRNLRTLMIGYIRKIIENSPVFFLRKIKTYLTETIFRLFGDTRPPKYILVTDEGNIPSNYKNNGYTEALYVNSFDYITVLKGKELPKPNYIPQYEYFVLLANHPWLVHDFKVAGHSKACIDEKKHAAMLNMLLDKIENATNVKVIIAAYPKATQDENIYNGRPFLYQTEQLVKYSKGVIGHHTGAWSFAVLHKKPMCLITVNDACDEFIEINQCFSEELGIPLHPIDTNHQCDEIIRQGIFTYNEDAIRSYSNKFLRSESAKNKTIMSSLIDKIENNFEL